jgi:NAD(P)-dependent dehydrogenase (short-subunit alcohol dehydrogenase family)
MPTNLFDLSGKIALVTGGTKGIGRAIVERMIDHGARVALTSRRAEDAAAVADTLNQAAGAKWPWAWLTTSTSSRPSSRSSTT